MSADTSNWWFPTMGGSALAQGSTSLWVELPPSLLFVALGNDAVPVSSVVLDVLVVVTDVDESSPGALHRAQETATSQAQHWVSCCPSRFRGPIAGAEGDPIGTLCCG